MEAITSHKEFLDRFLGYVEAFDEFHSCNALSIAKRWIRRGENELIYAFLTTNVIEYNLPFSMIDFASMSAVEVEYWQKYSARAVALLDERKALLQEFMSLNLRH